LRVPAGVTGLGAELWTCGCDVLLIVAGDLCHGEGGHFVVLCGLEWVGVKR